MRHMLVVPGQNIYNPVHHIIREFDSHLFMQYLDIYRKNLNSTTS